ncbi:hypothetical protein Q8F55_003980 [Vanrija albida]|uniref:Protein CPL1-like domain-containing protein n=1 Tax=Vanrija albida TaxID=181172 RepID=A0ABR3Q5H1_9TREE
MKFSSVALALLALPAALANSIPPPNEIGAYVAKRVDAFGAEHAGLMAARDADEASLMKRAAELDPRTFGHGHSTTNKGCSLEQRARCFVRGQNCDSRCSCVFPPRLVAPVPVVSPSSCYCTDWTKTLACWKNGQGVTYNCQCTGRPAKCQDYNKIALCHISGGRSVDGNCNCVAGPAPYPPSACKDPKKLGQCWKQGWGCNAKCVCITPTDPKPPVTQPTAVPGTCMDWFKVAQCACKKMKTDANCNCVPGTPVVPGTSSDCKDPAKLGQCWKQGWGCNAKCVCIKPPTPTSTGTVPTSTPTQIGQCKNPLLIKFCYLSGRAVGPDCKCLNCGCGAQRQCNNKGGKLDASCKCIVPSGYKKRRDETTVDSLCPAGKKACRIDGDGFDGQFECVDTSSDIESCGGCVAEGKGQDCSAIEGAGSVACVNAKCVVSSCAPGFALSGNATCTPSADAGFGQKVWGL